MAEVDSRSTVPRAEGAQNSSVDSNVKHTLRREKWLYGKNLFLGGVVYDAQIQASSWTKKLQLEAEITRNKKCNTYTMS